MSPATVMRERYGLSKSQAAAMIDTSDVLLLACPGSGKTLAVAGRIAWQVSRGTRLALLSFTNVGAQEISRVAAAQHDVVLTSDHFSGTLHSFLARYVLQPFGHLITGSSVSMRIDQDGANAFSPSGLTLSDYEYDLSHSVRHSKGWSKSENVLTAVAKAKQTAGAAGLVSQSDSLYIAYRVLTDYPHLASAFASRTDEVIIDEAQDTNALQFACLEILRTRGLKSIVLVGDYDQTIYEFGGSSPDACEAFANKNNLKTHKLVENWRSSQVVCDIASNFRLNKTPDVAVGPHAAESTTPRLFLYPPESPAGLQEQFAAALNDAGIAGQSRAILSYAGSLADSIRGHKLPKLPTLLSELVAYKKDPTAITIESYRILERALAKRSFGSEQPKLDRLLVRGHVASVLSRIPPLSGDLATWSCAALEVFDSAAAALADSVYLHGAPTPVPDSWKAVGLDKFAAIDRDASELKIGTIHSVKGKSIDAVLLVAEHHTNQNHPSNADVWSSAILKSPPFVPESLRLAYVAVTRARRFIAVALPTTTPKVIVDRYTAAGFTL